MRGKHGHKADSRGGKPLPNELLNHLKSLDVYDGRLPLETHCEAVIER